jgi:hypothetical protein
MTHPMISGERVRHLENQSDDQLFEELGYALFEKDLGGKLARPPKPPELITRARAWLTEQNETIATLVCEGHSLQELVKNGPTDREKIIIFISNALAAHYVGVPVATLAEILFRGGISKYCASRWATSAH